MNALLLAFVLAHSPSNATFCPTGKAVTGIPLQGKATCTTVSGGGGGSGLPADPVACGADLFAYDQNASGVLSCRAATWAGLASKPASFTPAPHTHPWTDVTSPPATYAPSAHTHPGTDVTTAVANATAAASVPWSGVTSPPATYAPSAHTHPQTDLTATGRTTTTFLRGDNTWANETWTNLAGKPTTFTPATHTHVATTDLTATGTKNNTTFLRGDDTWAAPPGGGGAPTTAQYWVGAADGTLSAEKDLSSFTGLVKNTAGTPSAAVAADLPGGPYLTSVTAHTLFGATHSDVDTAATTAGDIAVRNAANTQWTHLAPGGANTVLHGGATAPAYSAVADADFTGTLNASHGGLGQAQPTCATGTVLTCNGTTCSCTTVPTSYEVTALWTNSTATPSAVTGLSWAIPASTTQTAECFLETYTAATTTGLQLGATGPASPTAVLIILEADATTTANAALTPQAPITAFATYGAAAASPGATHQLARLTIIVQNGLNAGTVQVMGRSNTTSAVNIAKGSTCFVH